MARDALDAPERESEGGALELPGAAGGVRRGRLGIASGHGRTLSQAGSTSRTRPLARLQTTVRIALRRVCVTHGGSLSSAPVRFVPPKVETLGADLPILRVRFGPPNAKTLERSR